MARPRKRAAPPGEPELKFGARLRAAREALGMTVEQVAAEAGLTKGYISQLERDLSAPSLAALHRICSALGIRTGELMDPDFFEKPPLRVERRPLAGDDVSEHWALSDLHDPRFFAAESRIPPGGSPGEGRYAIPGDAEFVYILSGRLEFQIRDEVRTFAAGESFTYPIGEPHTWRNPSTKRDARVLWVAIPNPYVARRF